MLQNMEEQASLNGELIKNGVDECEIGGESFVSSSICSPTNAPIQNSSRPSSSMVIKKANTVIPAHLVAEAISTLHGLDLRWSGPITPAEMQYVQQYVFAKYPEYNNGLLSPLQDHYNHHLLDLEDESVPEHDDKKRSPSSSPSFGSANYHSSSSSSSPDYMSKIQLEPSKLLDILAKKTSYQGNFISIPEVQARTRALESCGLTEEDYLVVFTPNIKEAMMMVGESYPFFRGNYYMTVLGEDYDVIKEFVSCKDSKVILAPETWLDLRIKGSQLSQYFRKKCKYSPKGLFAYPAGTNGARSSMHWISEAHRNSWHVLLDASGLDAGNERLALALRRPDFVMCTVEIAHAQPSRIACLLVRKKSFDTAATSA